MKKFIKILLLNILVLVVLFFILEGISLVAYTYNDYISDKDDPDHSLKKFIKVALPAQFKLKYTNNNNVYGKYKYFNLSDFRPASIVADATKKPIVLLGCSYTWGDYIEYENIFSSVLSRKTNRTVYNLGLSGGSLLEMLYILRNNDALKRLAPDRKDVEYVIYTYIGDHRYRLYFNFRPKSPHFRVSDHGQHLKYIHDNPFLYSLLLDKIKSHYVYKCNVSYKLQRLFIKETYREVKKKFPNAKFVILIYYDYGDEDWEELKNDGIIVLNVYDLVQFKINEDKDYQVQDGHPNGKAWNTIVPPLVEELDL
ncbi:hypothetical protein IJ182_02300 [bacterium]|nr:hypothetical protein [bacterium]